MGEPCVSCGATQDPHQASCLGVPIFCPLCERDIGPIFPSLNSPRAWPEVEHQPNGMHLLHWPEESSDG